MTHHLPLPLIALGAIVALALLSGWPRVAALVLTGWVGLLGPGEVLGARKVDLVLPRGIGGLYPFAQLVMGSPKARLVAANQSVKTGPLGVVNLLDAV